MERDLQQLLDEKEEMVTERDVYRHKYERLNTELNYILKGDEKRVLDIDALVMENRWTFLCVIFISLVYSLPFSFKLDVCWILVFE